MGLFKPAVRGTQPIKLGLLGRSGAGKTYTALSVACHLAADLGAPGSVAMVDSEDRSGSLYANQACECDDCRGRGLRLQYHHLDLRDHAPERYRELINAARDEGFKVLVIDSISHEWSGRNGCLEQVDRLKGDGRKNATFDAWAQVTPKHNAFLQAIRSVPIHLIGTCRAKEKDGGIVAVQRDMDGGIEFEFQFFALVERAGLSIVKTRHTRFHGHSYTRPGGRLAAELLDWSRGDDAPAPPPAREPAQTAPAPPAAPTNGSAPEAQSDIGQKQRRAIALLKSTKEQMLGEADRRGSDIGAVARRFEGWMNDIAGCALINENGNLNGPALTAAVCDRLIEQLSPKGAAA